MPFSSTLIINQGVSRRCRNGRMSHLALNIQQIGPIADGIDGVGVAKLIRRQMRKIQFQTSLFQILPHPTFGKRAPFTMMLAYEQRSQLPW